MADNQSESFIDLQSGAEIGQYRLLSQLGAGGMGEVWLARDSRLTRDVALKFPSRKAFAGTDAYNHMLSEARSVAALNHPNIVTVHEVGDYRGQPFIAMAFVEGRSLQELLAQQRIPVKVTVSLGMQIADALVAAHGSGIVHRDLKPGNVIVDKTFCPHVVDFGLAVRHATAGSNDHTRTADMGFLKNVAAGTLRYMAPEQFAGIDSGPQVDLFAHGMILYEMAYATHPYGNTTTSGVYKQLLSDTEVPVSAEADEVPYDLTRIIRRCLQKDPEYRFQTARDVRNELRDLQRGLESGDARQWRGVDGSTAGGQHALQEHSFTITADLVRQLEYQSPKMIGDSIAYLDNGRFSDTLVIYLHAWGLDFRQCIEYLQELPYRAIAPTLYGFGEYARYRLPLPMRDHSLLLRALFAKEVQRVAPERVILAGHSSGADHLLHMAVSEEGFGIDAAGLLALGCNISLETCFISDKFAKLEHSSAEGLLEEIKQMGNSAGSLGEWLTMHEYLVTVFSKFGENADPLRAYGKDIVGPFEEHDGNQFATWCREVTAKYNHVRFVFDPDEYELVEAILMEHLKDNVLGDHFTEDTFVREEVSHVELASAELLMKQTRRLIEEIDAG